jgi:uncharacterized FAD-dependent dehydrogenase
MKEFAGCLPACSITAGWGGAGAYSDGKFNLTTEFGGWMQDYLPPSKVLELIEYVDSINLAHGATTTVTDPTTRAVAFIERRAVAAGLKLLKARVRAFCANPSGHVVIENHSGVMTANGHSFKDPRLGSANTISRRANDLSGGSVIVQKYGDILKGRRSTEKRIRESFIEPTLKEAVPGDLGLVLPYNTMKSLVEMMDALEKVTPGIASEHTLFYGVEAKFYSAHPKLNDKFETEIKGLFTIGDGAGITRGRAPR